MDDARPESDLPSGQAVRIARPVPSLVVLPDQGRHGIGPCHLVHEKGSDGGVLPDQLHVAHVEVSLRRELLVVQLPHPDVVEDRGHRELLRLGGRQGEEAGELPGQPSHAERMGLEG